MQKKRNKLTKQIMAILLILCMVLGMVPSGLQVVKPVEVEAAGGVEQKIAELRSIYPNGSYFSVNGRACSHGQNYTCTNCQLSYIMNAKYGGFPSGMKDGWTCCAFARFAYWYIFGISFNSAHSGMTSVDISQALPGDYVVLNNGGHYGIYLYSSGNNIYLFEANIGSPNLVKYGTVAYSKGSVSEVWRANNYATINATDPLTVPTITTNKEWYNVGETAQISWAKSGTNTDFYQYWLIVKNCDTNTQVYGGDAGSTGNVNKNSESVKLPTKGKYLITVYAVPYANKDKLQKISTKYITVGTDTTAPTVSNIKVSEVTAKGYKITCTVKDNASGVSFVDFVTWTEKNGQDDMYCTNGTLSGNTATFYVSAAQHNNETGNYITHIYACDKSGNKSNGIPVDTTYVANRSINPIGWVESITGGEGCIKVRGWTFDWSSVGTSLDVRVYIGGTSESGAKYQVIKANAKRTDVNTTYAGAGNYHGFEATVNTDLTGNQPVYVYAMNVGTGTNNTCIGKSTVNITKNAAPVVSDIKVSDVTAKGYRITCTVKDASAIKYVNFVSWTEKDGQDDRKSASGTISGNTASYYVSTSDHNNEIGNYITNIYAGDINGNSTEAISVPVTYVADRSDNPVGWVEKLIGKEGSIDLKGWSFDWNSVDTSLEIHVYIGGKKGSNAECHVIKANRSRGDVNDIYRGAGYNHGFEENIETSLTGKQDVYVYAINTGAGSFNPCIGEGTVNIAASTSSSDSQSTPSVSPSTKPNDEPKPNSSQSPNENPVKGDVNIDGKVDLADAQLTLKAALKIEALNDKQIENADVDGVTGIALSDAQMILKAALKIIVL